MATQYNVSFTLTVADAWMQDGFALTPALLKDLVQQGILEYAHDHEKTIESISIESEHVDRLYSYDELSNTAQEKALESLWDLNIDYEWWEHITETDIPVSGEVSGLNCQYGKEFDLENRSCVYITDISTNVSTLLNNCARTRADRPDFYCKVIAPFFAEFTTQELKNLLRLERFGLLGSLSGSTASGRRGRRYDVDIPYMVLRSEYRNLVTKDLHAALARDNRTKQQAWQHPRVHALCEKLEQAWDSLLEDIEHYYLSMLRDEYEYLTSRETVEESIRANEYQFTEDGTMS